MKYTIQSGAKPQFSERVKNNSRYLLPLLAVVVGVFFFTLVSHRASNNAKPSTLGIYTVNTPNGAKGDANNKNSSANKDATAAKANQLALASGSTMSPSSGGYSSSVSSATAATSPVLTGGMGGGTLTPPATTVATTGCTIGTLATPTVCGTCTAPISLSAGQKSILTSNGTCIAVDP